ncbi:hypothetical protein [Paracraurococcus lichenis]|uniref:Uncharacterized protein n=1 Tax=Paracraurococcus lichenis TaxID=3064888 RepID=A0ABT9DUV2_9PROT|nr:hypothetical protein [Paracraurococcus sp. LOR1-02]MDO9707681.1 hypothetical protein [Paracraurococcus sp. LOR1-02]
MFQAFEQHRHWWEDAAAALLALGYIGGFLLAVEIAVAKLLFRSFL